MMPGLAQKLQSLAKKDMRYKRGVTHLLDLAAHTVDGESHPLQDWGTERRVMVRAMALGDGYVDMLPEEEMQMIYSSRKKGLAYKGCVANQLS